MGIVLAYRVSSGPSPDFPFGALVDDFNRVNEGVPEGWSLIEGAPRIVGNQAMGTLAQQENHMKLGTSYNATQAWFVTVTALPEHDNPLDEGLSLFARMDVSNSGFDVQFIRTGDATGILRIWESVNGAIGGIQVGETFNFTPEAGFAFGIVCSESDIAGWYKAAGGSWAQVITGSNGDQTHAGAPSMGMFGNVGVYDNLGGGNI